MARKLATAYALNLTGAWRYIIAQIANSYSQRALARADCVLYKFAVARASHAAARLHARADSKDDDLSNYKWLT